MAAILTGAEEKCGESGKTERMAVGSREGPRGRNGRTWAFPLAAMLVAILGALIAAELGMRAYHTLRGTYRLDEEPPKPRGPGSGPGPTTPNPSSFIVRTIGRTGFDTPSPTAFSGRRT